MSVTEKRLNPLNGSNDCMPTSVPEIPSNSSNGMPELQLEQLQSLTAKDISRPTVEAANVGESLGNMGYPNTLEVQPTLRLRIKGNNLDAWQETENDVNHQNVGHSKSADVSNIKPLQAVTQPRRIQMPTNPLGLVNRLESGMCKGSSSTSSSSRSGNSSSRSGNSSSSSSNSTISTYNANTNANKTKWLTMQGHKRYSEHSIERQLQRLQNARDSIGSCPDQFAHRLTFDQWLKTKKKLDAERRRQNQRNFHHQCHQQQMRKQMSDRSYAEWLHSKRHGRRTTGGGMQQLHLQQLHQYQQQLQLAKSRSKHLTNQLAMSNLQARSMATHRSVVEWENRKLQQIDRQRNALLSKQRDLMMREQLRQELSQLAWQRWLTQTALRENRLQCILPDAQPVAEGSKAAAKQLRHALQHERKLQHQIELLYQHVPLSKAQRTLRHRYDNVWKVQ